MRVSGVSLGISSRKDSVNKDKSANNLSTKTITLGVAMVHRISSTTQHLITVLFESLHNSSTTDCTKALHHYVENSSCKRQFPCQKQTKSHSWVYMSSCTNNQMHTYRSGLVKIETFSATWTATEAEKLASLKMKRKKTKENPLTFSLEISQLKNPFFF